MQTQGLTTGSQGTARHASGSAALAPAASPGTRLAISALVVGAAFGAWSAWGLERIAATAGATAADVAPITAAAPLGTAGRVTGTGRSLVVSIPGDDAYMTSSSLPVAGIAYGRPHGPAIAAVHVELVVGGRSITSTDLPVFSGRYAGVLQVAGLTGRTKAELRVSDPLHRGSKGIVRTLTLDPR